MSRKTVSFAVPAKVSRAREPAGRRAPEDWVRNMDFGGVDPMAISRSERFVVDLAAERTLFEVFTLSMLAPVALGWFWLMNAMAGRVRF